MGDLVFTTFSGSHQDAIKKGLAVQAVDGLWEVPYLPMDPADVGRSYAAVVRVNSQSGKVGIAFLLEQHYGVVLPRRLLIEFSGVVQATLDNSGQELTAADIWQLLKKTYLRVESPLQYRGHELSAAGERGQLQKTVAQGAIHR